MKKQSGSAHVIIIVILVIALLGVLGFVFWQNFINKKDLPTDRGLESSKDKMSKIEPAKVDPYAGWLTYTSDRDHYTVMYPKDWLVVPENNLGDGPYIRNFDPTTKKKNEGAGYPDGYMNVRVLVQKEDSDANYKAISGLTMREWYNTLGVKDVSDGAVTYKKEDVKDIKVGTINAKSAKSVFTETNQNIYFMRGEWLYLINLYPYGASDNQTVKLIIDSIKFLDA